MDKTYNFEITSFIPSAHKMSLVLKDK